MRPYIGISERVNFKVFSYKAKAESSSHVDVISTEASNGGQGRARSFMVLSD